MLRGTDRWCPHVSLPKWARDYVAAKAPWIRPEYTIERRMPVVLSSYPKLARKALDEIASNPYKDQLALIFREWWVDSALEALFWLRLAGRSAIPGWLPPAFRLHPVICDRSEASAVDRPHPCLVLPHPVPSIWFSQVTILLPPRVKQRLDALVCTGPDRWCNVEIDGDGHRFGRDEQRDKEKLIPVLRLDAADVQGKDLPARVGQWIASA